MKQVEVVYRLRAVDLAVLLQGLYDIKDVQLDTTYTYQELLTMVDGLVEVRRAAAEAMLYAAIEAKEQDKWEHPEGLTWEQWRDRLAAGGITFNDTYGFTKD